MPPLDQISLPLEIATISLSIPVSTTSVEKSFSQNLLMKTRETVPENAPEAVSEGLKTNYLHCMVMSLNGISTIQLYLCIVHGPQTRLTYAYIYAYDFVKSNQRHYYKINILHSCVGGKGIKSLCSN